MSSPSANRFRASLWWLVVVVCACRGMTDAANVSLFAQGSKPPTMGSAGTTGGTVPSSTSPPGQRSKPESVPSDSGETPPEPEKPTPVPPARSNGRETSPSPMAMKSTASSEIPAFHLARLVLDGEVIDDRALITAQIDVDVNREDIEDGKDVYHDVPLRLIQAHVLSKEYKGSGKEGPVVDRPLEEGIVWRFTGHGTHQLTLKMWVPIRQSPAGRQLVLSLPSMPPGFDAQVHLTIPGPAVVIRANRDLSVLSNEKVGEANRVSADVRGPRLDMTWSELPEFQTSFLEATTSVTLRRGGDRVIAEAEQVLLPEDVGVKEAEIKLPDGFELVELTGPLLKGHEPILGRNDWHKLSFREASGERIDLKWVLSAPFPASGGTLQFDGLVVPDARSQVGRIQLQDFPGYQMVPRPGQFVRRSSANSPQVTEAFEYTKQPFRIAWDVQRVAPKFSVLPRHLLFVGTTQMVLDCRFRIQTDAGSLDQVDLDWPSAMADGWRLDPASVSGGATVTVNGDQLSSNGRLSVGWKTLQTGTFDVSLRFLRSIPSGMRSAKVSLPNLRGARTQSTSLLIAAEDQLELNVTTVSGGAFTPVATDPQRLEEVAPALVSQIQKSVQLDSGQNQLDVNWKTQSRTVEADAELELRRATDGRVRVQQTVRLQSRFGRLSVLRFQLPKNLTGLIPAGASSAAIGLTVDGQTIAAQLREGVIEAPLAEPKLGVILATLEYSLPAAGNSDQPFVVPVLTSIDAAYSSTRVRIPEGEPLHVPPSAEGWQPVPTAPDATVWVTTTATQVAIQLDADQITSPRFSVDHVFYRTRIDNVGRIEGICEMHWSGDVRGLPVTLPPKSELLGYLFNGKPLSVSEGQIVRDAANPDQILFRFPPSQEGSRLAIWYRILSVAGFSHRDLRTVQLPVLPKDVSVVRSTWELELPAGRHLFIGPSDLTPEHVWRRGGLLWSRVPVSQYLEERESATVEARQLTTLSDPSQVYAFSSIGPIEAPRFQSMTRSLILMLGAGLTLAMGFLFWTLPITRNMLALLLIAFGVSLLSLWFLEPIQLLLQPAILGAMLAILASLIDLKSRRPGRPSFSGIGMPIPVSINSPVSTSSTGPGESSQAGRGSSVVRPRSHPVQPTAIYQPGSSEVGRP